MAMFIDARIPVVFGAEPCGTDAVLVPGGSAPHPPGCGCCLARSPDAAGLDQLFLDRVRGTVPWFTRVVVTTEHAGLRAAIASDPVLSARYRLG